MDVLEERLMHMKLTGWNDCSQFTRLFLYLDYTSTPCTIGLCIIPHWVWMEYTSSIQWFWVSPHNLLWPREYGWKGPCANSYPPLVLMPFDTRRTCLVWTSLVVQWLGLQAPNAGDLGSIPSQGTRSHKPPLRVQVLQLKILHATMKMSHAATMTQYSQIN